MKDILEDLLGLWRAGRFAEAGEKYWAADVVSIEAAVPGGNPVSRGFSAVREKGRWWADNHEVHSVKTTRPFLNGSQFIVGFEMDLTQKASGQRITVIEQALYAIRDGKIVEERFFHPS